MKFAQLALGASFLAGMMTAPAMAANLTGVDFGTETDFRTYRSNPLTDTETFTDGDAADAISALTDNDVLTHVELATSDETGTSVVGFDAELGGHNIRVESVTAADWVGGLKDQWVADFIDAYPALAGFAGLIGDTAFTRGGDANIGMMTKDDISGDLQVDLIGHLNVLDAPWVSTVPQFAALAPAVNAALGGAALQISEIAKVIIDGDVTYAYGFKATPTGFVGADGSSHSGLYSVIIPGDPNTEDVPEPASVLGLVALGGLAIATKRKSLA
jgi:hypothetical protein